MERLAYRIAETAELIGCSRAKVYDMATKGQIPTVRIGGMLRVPADALSNWLREQANVSE